MKRNRNWKYRILAVVAVVFGCGAIGCGDQLPTQQGLIMAQPPSVEVATGIVGPYRETIWITFTTMSYNHDPYDYYHTPAGENIIIGPEASPHTRIVFNADFSNEGFDDFLIEDADGNLVPPLILLDNGGREVPSPFETETDDNGNYVLGVNYSIDARLTYTAQLFARSGSIVTSVEFDISSDL